MAQGQSGPGDNGIDWVLWIRTISNAGASPSDSLLSYPGNSLEGSYPYAEVESVYSTVFQMVRHFEKN